MSTKPRLTKVQLNDVHCVLWPRLWHKVHTVLGCSLAKTVLTTY